MQELRQRLFGSFCAVPGVHDHWKSADAQRWNYRCCSPTKRKDPVSFYCVGSVLDIQQRSFSPKLSIPNKTQTDPRFMQEHQKHGGFSLCYMDLVRVDILKEEMYFNHNSNLPKSMTTQQNTTWVLLGYLKVNQESLWGNLSLTMKWKKKLQDP